MFFHNCCDVVSGGIRVIAFHTLYINCQKCQYLTNDRARITQDSPIGSSQSDVWSDGRTDRWMIHVAVINTSQRTEIVEGSSIEQKNRSMNKKRVGGSLCLCTLSNNIDWNFTLLKVYTFLNNNEPRKKISK